jgi:hypothetical protein
MNCALKLDGMSLTRKDGDCGLRSPHLT